MFGNGAGTGTIAITIKIAPVKIREVPVRALTACSAAVVGSNYPRGCRAAYRCTWDPTNSNNYVGFRLAHSSR